MINYMTLMEQNGRPLETGDKFNLTLFISFFFFFLSIMLAWQKLLFAGHDYIY